MKSALLTLLLLAAACGGNDDSNTGTNDGGDTDGGDPGPKDAATNIALTPVQAYANLTGRAVGTLSATGQETGDAITFTLTNDAGGKFALAGNVISATQTAIANSDAPTLTIEVTATSAAGGTFSKSIDITVVPTINVTSNADTGAGSLRQALTDATSGGVIALNTTSTIALASSLSGFGGKNITIIGGGTGASISGSNMTDIIDTADGDTVTLMNLDLSNAPKNAIQNNGTLVIDHVTIHDNGSDSRGGAVDSAGTATLRNCTIENNHAFNGGGVVNEGGTMHIDSCVFTNNSADGNSGGGFINAGGTADIINTVFEGNHADSANRLGGAIAVFGDDEDASVIAKTTLAFVTIVGNTTAAVNGQGPGIYADTHTETHIRASVIAGNTSGSGTNDDVLSLDATGTFILEGYTIIGNGDGGVITSTTTDQIGTSAAPIAPLLATLGSNGGTAESMAPQAGSPCLDKVPVSACTDILGAALTTDIRGQARPTGSACDIGATEASN